MAEIRFDSLDVDGTLNVDGQATMKQDVTLENGKSIKAKRNDGVAIIALGYLAGAASILQMILGGGMFQQLDTGSKIVSLFNHFTANIANNASAVINDVPSYASITISDTNSGETAVLILTNTALSIQYQTAANFSLVAGTAAKINVTWAANVLTIENKSGAGTTFRVTILGRPG